MYDGSFDASRLYESDFGQGDRCFGGEATSKNNVVPSSARISVNSQLTAVCAPIAPRSTCFHVERSLEMFVRVKNVLNQYN